MNTLWFVAFGPLGEAIADSTRKGDQLFLEARVESRHWIDGEGAAHDEHIFVVTGFRFGALGGLLKRATSESAEEGNG